MNIATDSVRGWLRRSCKYGDGDQAAMQLPGWFEAEVLTARLGT